MAGKVLEQASKLLGRRSEVTWFSVTREAVDAFVDAIGAPRERFVEVAPPTFPMTFREGQRPEMDGLPEGMRLHASQAYRYVRPVQIGEAIGCSTQVVDVYEKEGRSGTLTFVAYETAGIDRAGELVFTATRTRVYRAKGE